MSVESLEFIELFYSYAQQDEGLLNELESHLAALKRDNVIRGWHHQNIPAGTNQMQAINTHLNTAHIILLLISSDFINSDYCYSVEMRQAIERHKQGKARVVPILLRPVDLEGTPIASLRALPTSGKPIISWPNRDEAFTDVSKSIRKVIQDLKGRPGSSLIKTASSEAEEIDDTLYFKEGSAVVGITLDLSLSMKKSMQNNTQGQISHLDSARQSLHDLSKSARRSIRESKIEHSSIDMFVYGFGFKDKKIHDLLSFIKAGKQIITKDIIDASKKEYQQEKREKFKGFEGLGDLLTTWGLPVEIAKDVMQNQAERTVRRRIFRQWKDEIVKRAQEIGDTTLPLDEIAEWWDTSEDVLGNADDLIFGTTTPIAAVLETTIQRFEQELQQREEKPRLILFLVSDGKFSSSTPLRLAAQLQAMGATIVSCLVTDSDSANPRELRHDPWPEWTSGAKMMFEMASQLEPDTEIERFLLRKGWTIYPQPKLFVQVNHSDVLKEFIRVTLSDLEDEDDSETLPRGY